MERVELSSHPADPLPYLLTDHRVARLTHYEDGLWLRIMDIPTVLEARTYQTNLSVVLEVSDGFRSDGGRFALDVRDGRAHCTATTAEADVRMDLDALGSLYMGAHKASSFAAVNRLRTNNYELVAQLDAAFASDVPAMLGYGF
jgi:predicted acetyltransferase